MKLVATRGKFEERPNVTVLALTQFAFITLAIVSLKILVHSSSSVSNAIRTLDRIAVWLFTIPVIWTIAAAISPQTGNSVQSLARRIGVILAVISFLILVAVVFNLPRYF